MSRAALLPILVLIGACASSIGPGDIERLPSGTKFYLADVYFDYDTWVRVSSDEKDKAREKEPEWSGALKEGFLSEARKLGILGEGAGTRKVTISLVDTYPGSEWAGDLIGHGSARAVANADVTIKDHGTFEMSKAILNDNVNGELRTLGIEIARYLRRKSR